jgi:uncharacterized RDD family membrane protein YckC
LESWVEQQLKQGYDIDEIEEAAGDRGWSKEKIKEAEKVASRNSTKVENNSNNPQNKELNPAALRRRIAAYILDVAIVLFSIISLSLILLLGSIIAGLGTGGTALIEFSTKLIVPMSILFFPTYFVFLEANYGKTVGKKVLDLQVKTTEGEKIGLKHSLIRNLLRAVDEEISLYLIGVISILVTDKSQRVGDKVAGTIVVKE